MVGDRRNFKTEGIVLKRSNYGEADRVVVFYTKHFGKMVCMAKGVRRTNSRKRASVELFTRLSLNGIVRTGMNLITETNIIDSYPNLRKDFRRIRYAHMVGEITDRLTLEGSETEGVYPLIIQTIERIRSVELSELEYLIGDFSGRLLIVLGFWPANKTLPVGPKLFAYIEQITEKKLNSRNYFGRVEEVLSR